MYWRLTTPLFRAANARVTAVGQIAQLTKPENRLPTHVRRTELASRYGWIETRGAFILLQRFRPSYPQPNLFKLRTTTKISPIERTVNWM